MLLTLDTITGYDSSIKEVRFNTLYIDIYNGIIRELQYIGTTTERQPVKTPLIILPMKINEHKGIIDITQDRAMNI